MLTAKSTGNADGKLTAFPGTFALKHPEQFHKEAHLAASKAVWQVNLKRIHQL